MVESRRVGTLGPRIMGLFRENGRILHDFLCDRG